MPGHRRPFCLVPYMQRSQSLVVARVKNSASASRSSAAKPSAIVRIRSSMSLRRDPSRERDAVNDAPVARA
jgi:hypothetical protein